MAATDHIIKIIELILREAELKTNSIAPFLSVYANTLRSKKIDHDELLRILKKLEKEGCISTIIRADGNSEWEYAILDSTNNHLLKFRSNTKRLLSYKEDLIEKYDKPKKPSNIQIFISKERGIYRETENEELKYPITVRRYNLVYNLRSNKIFSKDLASLYNPKDPPTKAYISKVIKEINKIFMKRLDLSDNLIIHIETGGYKLNRDKFNITFSNFSG